jgi:hypothetical protein
MDLNGGALNLSAVELLRTLKTIGEWYKRDILLPLAASIKQVFENIEKLGNTRLPYELLHLVEQGEAIKFDEDIVSVLLIRASVWVRQNRKRKILTICRIDERSESHKTPQPRDWQIEDDRSIRNLLSSYKGTTLHGRLCQSPVSQPVWRIHMGREKSEMYNHFSSMF